MKQLLLFITIIFALSACKKEVIVPRESVQSFTYDATASSWGTSDQGFTWSANLPVPEITSAVLNSGMVAVYIVYTANNTTFNDPMPIFYPGSGIAISSSISAGNVDIYYESTTTNPLENPGPYTFRVVVVNGNGKMEYQPAKNEYLIKSTVRL